MRALCLSYFVTVVQSSLEVVASPIKLGYLIYPLCCFGSAGSLEAAIEDDASVSRSIEQEISSGRRG